MPSKLFGLFITSRKSKKWEKGFKMWFIGMRGESRTGKQKIVLISNTEGRRGNTTISPNRGFAPFIFYHRKGFAKTDTNTDTIRCRSCSASETQTNKQCMGDAARRRGFSRNT